MIWNPTKFHLELTNKCSAKCPFCMRTEKGVEKFYELSISDIQNFFTKTLCKNITHIILCGSFGDPIYARDFLKIVEFFNLEDIKILVHTNGYNSQKGFWTQLAQFRGVYVVFGIDGITQEVHQKHRVGTQLDRILKNAYEFNQNGGKSSWQFILFLENSHQVEKAREISKKLGFEKFFTQDSRAYSSTLHNPNYKEKSEKKVFHGSYECKYKKNNELYINAQGQLLPCCWLSQIEKSEEVLIDPFMNIKNNDFQKIQKRATWLSTVGKFYYEDVGNMCLRKCGV